MTYPSLLYSTGERAKKSVAEVSCVELPNMVSGVERASELNVSKLTMYLLVIGRLISNSWKFNMFWLFRAQKWSAEAWLPYTWNNNGHGHLDPQWPSIISRILTVSWFIWNVQPLCHFYRIQGRASTRLQHHLLRIQLAFHCPSRWCTPVLGSGWRQEPGAAVHLLMWWSEHSLHDGGYEAVLRAPNQSTKVLLTLEGKGWSSVLHLW